MINEDIFEQRFNKYSNELAILYNQGLISYDEYEKAIAQLEEEFFGDYL